MEEVIGYYILKKDNKLEFPIILEDRKGNKVYRGKETIIVNEVFLTKSNVYFSGAIGKNDILECIYMNELTVEAVNEYVTFSKKMNEELYAFFTTIRYKIKKKEE